LFAGQGRDRLWEFDKTRHRGASRWLLLQAAHRQGLLATHKEGLIALSGCLASEIPESIQRDQLPKRARRSIGFKQTLGAENFYLELQNHGIADQAKVNRYLIPWAKEFGLKLVATNDVHYVERSHSPHAHGHPGLHWHLKPCQSDPNG